MSTELVVFIFGILAVFTLIYGAIMVYGIREMRRLGQSAFEHLKARSLEDLSTYHEAEAEAKVRIQARWDETSSEKPTPKPKTVLGMDGTEYSIDDLEM